MTTLLTPTAADRMSRLTLLLVLALLVTTPLRVHALIGVLLLYALAYLVAHPEARGKKGTPTLFLTPAQ
ncbi:hypothetical protein [Halomonas sp. A11-A]|uniref:hypothetical protein n=1 Tax=Halomonas sp. A11-A TaxID=2183985 RepID=UPI000D85F089|nr:hypothetical protein [Halomonas sp. A11-A]PWV72639.1 hypothetical protein DER72_1173 [Halomonas sp. A11-A]